MTATDRETLLAAGYREYPQKNDPFRRSLFQKSVRGAQGAKLYAINVWYWVLPDPMGVSFEYEVALYLPGDDRPVWVKKSNMALEAAEAFFATVYEVMGCSPDPLNQ